MIGEEKLRELSQNLISDKEDYMTCFYKNLNMYLANPDITIREVSEAADIPFATLNSFLYGKPHSDCKLSTAVKLARAFGITIDEMVGSETLTEQERHTISTVRTLSERSKYLIGWYIEREADFAKDHQKENKKVISVMQPQIDEEGNLRPTDDMALLDISEYRNNVRPKIFLGIRMVCDYYMPRYTPFDTLLIANDRRPRQNENSVIIYGKMLFIVQGREEIDENGEKVFNYYSIRDGKFRVTEKDVDDVIGYIAAVYQEDE